MPLWERWKRVHEGTWHAFEKRVRGNLKSQIPRSVRQNPLHIIWNPNWPRPHSSRLSDSVGRETCYDWAGGLPSERLLNVQKAGFSATVRVADHTGAISQRYTVDRSRVIGSFFNATFRKRFHRPQRPCSEDPPRKIAVSRNRASQLLFISEHDVWV